ncbi:MAG: GNAT family N-acetyltransferase [SAR202 cluster bacterium]|nr:GNAT family N-acetyltransferase [SAR202 cluster bacterium]
MTTQQITDRITAELEGPRACGKYELACVLDTANYVMRYLQTPAGQPTRLPTIGFDWSHIYHQDNLENIRVITHDGKVVTTIAIFPQTVRTPRGNISVGGINCFATLPDYRRRGLGEAVLLDAHKKMKDNGHHIALLTTTVHDYYRKFGWESAGTQRSYVFDRGNIGLLPSPNGMEISDDWRPDMADIIALHQHEPLICLRSPELFRLLADHRLNRMFVAKVGGRPMAYAGIREGALVEYGGSPSHVAALIRAVFEALDDPNQSTTTRAPTSRATIELAVKTPEANTGLPRTLDTLGIPMRAEYIGMILILDAPGLFKTLGITEVTLERRDAGWRLQYQNRKLDLTERQLVKLVFGPERYPHFAPDVFPIDFYQWKLDIV